MEVLDSKNEVTVVLEDRSVTISKKKVDYLDKEVLITENKEQERIVKDMSDEYVSVKDAPSRASGTVSFKPSNSEEFSFSSLLSNLVEGDVEQTLVHHMDSEIPIEEDSEIPLEQLNSSSTKVNL